VGQELEKIFTHPLRKSDGRGTLDDHGAGVGLMGRRRVETTKPGLLTGFRDEGGEG
jgi:hypothetical protein